MVKLSHNDATQIFNSCILFYKNRPVYMEHLSPDFKATILNLLSQRKTIVNFKFEDFSSPVRRIGFININQSVVYCYRLPVRKYKAGICSENIKVNLLEVTYPLGRVDTKDLVLSLNSPDLGDALMNKYPSFKEALKLLADGYAAVAFDKQFAICSHGRVWYKTTCVGEWLSGKIVFNAGYEHLELLLKEHHAKTI